MDHDEWFVNEVGNYLYYDYDGNDPEGEMLDAAEAWARNHISLEALAEQGFRVCATCQRWVCSAGDVCDECAVKEKSDGNG
jgi:hypothetical protein